MGGMIMKKYFFVAFKAFNGKNNVGCGGLIVVCSCDHKRMVEALLEHYNKHAEYKADKVITNALTFLDKQTASQLSNNFINGALIIDDGEKEEPAYIERWLARDKDGTLCLHIGQEPPRKQKIVWADDYDNYIELDGSLFKEVQWSDDEPTKVRLVIDK